MTKNLLLLAIFSLLSLKADCTSYYILGSQEQTLSKSIATKDTIIWDYSKNSWITSQPKDIPDISKVACKEKGYLLINDNNISYSTPSYTKNYYELTQGWNYLHSHENGVNMQETFSKYKEIEFVYMYEPVTKAWAGYSPSKELQDTIYTTKILDLKNIEPNKGFYVYATKDVKVEIKSLEINDVCKKIIADEKYAVLVNSGTNDEFTYNKEKTIALKSRYKSHHVRGVYDETRVLLLYPKLQSKTKRSFKYGPADPKTQIEFTTEYEGETFYMYSYKDNKCYKGIFPSVKIPPMAGLKEIKDYNKTF